MIPPTFARRAVDALTDLRDDLRNVTSHSMIARKG